MSVNTRLVESLAEAIAALPNEDYVLFQASLITKLVQKTPSVCGGHARIRNTRIAVWTIVSLLNQGSSDVELLENFPSLTQFDLIATRIYYQAHRAEIDDLITSHDHA